MKINIKHLSLYAMFGCISVGTTSCNDLLDLDPVSQITPNPTIAMPTNWPHT